MEEFNEELISPLQYKVNGKQPNVFKQPTLICLVTIEELPNDRYPQGSVELIGLLWQC